MSNPSGGVESSERSGRGKRAKRAGVGTEAPRAGGWQLVFADDCCFQTALPGGAQQSGVGSVRARPARVSTLGPHERSTQGAVIGNDPPEPLPCASLREGRSYRKKSSAGSRRRSAARPSPRKSPPRTRATGIPVDLPIANSAAAASSSATAIWVAARVRPS